MKTNFLASYLPSSSLLFLLFSVALLHGKALKGQHLVAGQDSAYPLYSKISPVQLKEFQKAFNFESFQLNRVHALRKTLEGYLKEEDALAQFLYGASMDLYPYGVGQPKEAAIALTYYTKAADKGLAAAEHLLFKTYRYSFMDVPRDEEKSLAYLWRAIQHGNKESKASGYLALATLFESGEFSTLSANQDSVLFYLEKALIYTPNDTWALDYAAGIYEEKGNYEKAIAYKLRGDNPNSHITVAEWLIKGEHVRKDVARALKIIYKEAEAIVKEYGKNYLGSAGGGTNAVFTLNDWYYCKKWITREQVSKYLYPTSVCD